jgi:hypothetical protein
MMDCNLYRRTVLAEPELIRRGPVSADLQAHRESCHLCAEYTLQVLRFESRLERALRVDVSASGGGAAGAGAGAAAGAASAGAKVVPFRAKRRGQSAAARPPGLRNRWLGIAASALLAVVVAGALWLSAPGSSLAADVVTHMAEEPQAWRVTDVAVPDSALEAVLRDSHLRLGNGAGIVSYASACAFRGHIVPHLVVQTGSGPVTVMVLVHEHVSQSVPFNEEGYRGVIVPVAGHGSLAVLTRAPDTDTHGIEQIARRVASSIVWTG